MQNCADFVANRSLFYQFFLCISLAKSGVHTEAILLTRESVSGTQTSHLTIMRYQKEGERVILIIWRDRKVTDLSTFLLGMEQQMGHCWIRLLFSSFGYHLRSFQTWCCSCQRHHYCLRSGLSRSSLPSAVVAWNYSGRESGTGLTTSSDLRFHPHHQMS